MKLLVPKALAIKHSVFEKQVLENFAVSESVRSVLPESGLVRGRIVRCCGDAAISLALSLCARASQQGSWLGVVGVDHLGISCAVEHGIALERVVFVYPPEASRDWSTTVAAAIDGFDLLIVAVPERLSIADARRVQARLVSRRSVMIIVDAVVLSQNSFTNNSHPFHADLLIDTKTKNWSGINNGAGFLQHRQVEIKVSGRRVAREQRHLLTCSH
ncbi:MAG: hypothetical protein ACKOFM_02445 [Actinomycetota bacterium]